MYRKIHKPPLQLTNTHTSYIVYQKCDI